MIKLVICIAAFLSLVTSTPIQQCPVIVRHENSIPDRYFVKFRDSATMDTILMATNTNTTTLMDNWIPDLNVFIGEFNPDQFSTLQLNSDIEYIEQDAAVTLNMPISEGSGELEDELIPEDPIAPRPGVPGHMIIQKKAPWALERMSIINRTVSQDAKRMNFQYKYWSPIKKNKAVVYVLDSGIYLKHSEFGRRARWGATFIGDPKSKVDEFGHGTMMAGVIAGRTYGVAKNAELIAVKVMDKNGGSNLTNIANGLRWIIDEVKDKDIETRRQRIVNMSIDAGTHSPTLNGIIYLLKNLQVHLVAAAGNMNRKVETSPADSPYVITVGASNIADSRWVDGSNVGSNWGKGVNLFAPGKSIHTASKDSPKSHTIDRGTSLSAAYVSGLLAYFITLSDDIRPVFLRQVVLDYCQKNHLRGNIGNGSPNYLAANGMNGWEGWGTDSDSEAQFVMDSAQIPFNEPVWADDSDE